MVSSMFIFDMSSDEKSVNVLYSRSSILKNVTAQQAKCGDSHGVDIVGDISKQMRKEVQALCAEFERRDDNEHLNCALLENAAAKANNKEVSITDKFVNNVQIMMNRFNTDMEKLQKIYENVMKNMPKCEN